jgi:four helix bundle protein
VARDFNFCDQIRRSARSAPANLAEGFGRHRPRDNARFVRIALASLHETQNHLAEGRKCGYFGELEFTELLALSKEAIRTAVGWHQYLATCDHDPLRNPRPADPETLSPAPDEQNREPGTEN